MTSGPTQRTDSDKAMTQRTARASATRRRLGTVMLAVAVVGVIVSAVGTVVAWRLVGDLNASSRDSLNATIETLDTVENSIELADSVIVATTATLDTAAATLTAVSTSFGDASGVIDEIDTLTESVGPALDQVAKTLRQLQGVGTTIDDALEGLDDLPFAPNYDGGAGLGPTIAQLAEEIEPLPAEFESASTELDGFGTSITTLTREVQQLSADVRIVSAELDGTDVLIDSYRSNITDARRAAVEARDDLTGNVGLIRILFVIGGINLVVAQVVPFWLGRALRRTAGAGGSERDIIG